MDFGNEDFYGRGYGRARAPYYNPGQSLINFSQFQPTFVGQPIAEMGQAYKSYRDTADIIMNSEDALAETLAQANVDPIDRPGLVERKQWLDEGIKKIAASGDFGPAKIQMRNLLNRFRQDQFIPAAENRYKQKLEAIKTVNTMAANQELSPQRLELKLNDINKTFTATTPDQYGKYTTEYIPPVAEKEFDFHTFLTQFMENKKKTLEGLGYTPVYGMVPSNPNDINSPKVERLLAFRHGVHGEIPVAALEQEASDALRVNGKAKPTIRDLSRYYTDKSITDQNPTLAKTEDQIITDMVIPYAELFGVNEVVPDYDRIFDYSNNNAPSTYQPPTNTNIATMPGLVTNETPYDFGKMQAYPGPILSQSYYTDPNGITRTSAPKYNLNALPDKEKAVAMRMVTGLYGIDAKKIATDWNTKEIQDMLDVVFANLGNLSSGSKIVNNKAIQYDPGSKHLYERGVNSDSKIDDETYQTRLLFGLNPGDITKDATPSAALQGRKFYNLSTNQEMTYKEVEDLLKITNMTKGVGNPAVRITHELTPENYIPFVTGNYGFNRATIAQIGTQSIAISQDPTDINEEDILLNKISSAALAPKQLIPMPEFYNSNLVTMEAGTGATGNPIFTYTNSMTPTGQAAMDKDISDNILQDARVRIEFDKIRAANPSWRYGDIISEARAIVRANNSTSITPKEQQLIDDYYTNNPSYTAIKSSGNLNAFSSGDMLNNMKLIQPEIYFFTKSY